MLLLPLLLQDAAGGRSAAGRAAEAGCLLAVPHNCCLPACVAVGRMHPACCHSLTLLPAVSRFLLCCCVSLLILDPALASHLCFHPPPATPTSRRNVCARQCAQQLLCNCDGGNRFHQAPKGGGVGVPELQVAAAASRKSKSSSCSVSAVSQVPCRRLSLRELEAVAAGAVSVSSLHSLAVGFKALPLAARFSRTPARPSRSSSSWQSQTPVALPSLTTVTAHARLHLQSFLIASRFVPLVLLLLVPN